MAIVEVNIVPIGRGDISLSEYIARALSVLRGSGLPYDLTAMGTIISGDLDQIMSVIREMHESCFVEGIPRVLTTVRIDDRRDRLATPEQKVKAVLDRLRG